MPLQLNADLFNFTSQNPNNSLSSHLQLTLDVTLTPQANISISQFPTYKVNLNFFTSTYRLFEQWAMFEVVVLGVGDHCTAWLCTVLLVFLASTVKTVRGRVPLISTLGVGLQ